MLKKLFLTLMVAAFFLSCSDEKKEQAMQSQIDSLRVELRSSQETASTLQEVGLLIDSIDANRQLLRTDMVEGTSMTNYKSRLQDINDYVKQTQNKLAELEKSSRNSKVFAGTIKKLRADLAARMQQITALETEVQRMREENMGLARNVSQRDSLLAVGNETIRMREERLAQLETEVQELNVKSKNDQAEAYFNQAVALEKAADRTRFAPKKRKETKREALELYKMAHSLGKEEAQAKIQELEKEVS